MTKGITLATAKAVAAGNSCRQEDVIATANLSRRAIADMLRACKVGWAGGLEQAWGEQWWGGGSWWQQLWMRPGQTQPDSLPAVSGSRLPP